jgi:hypothetical protein
MIDILDFIALSCWHKAADFRTGSDFRPSSPGPSQVIVVERVF